ncbi:MAG: hypothetical protein AAF403_03335 [Pseudomonadota bacterium]
MSLEPSIYRAELMCMRNDLKDICRIDKIGQERKIGQKENWSKTKGHRIFNVV